MKRFIPLGICLASFCPALAQICEFVNPPYVEDIAVNVDTVSVEYDVNPLWLNTAGKGYARYIARYNLMMQQGEVDSDLSAMRLSDGLQCVHNRYNGNDIYFVVNPTDKSLKVTALRDSNNRSANIYNPVEGTIFGMIPSPDSRGVYREVILNPKESIFIVFEKYNAPKIKAYDSEIVLSVISDLENVGSNPDSNTYSASVDVPTKRLRKERNMGNRFIIELGDVKDAAIVRVNASELADTLWSAPFNADITDRLIGGGNEIEVTVINRSKDDKPFLKGPVMLKLLKKKTILDITTNN